MDSATENARRARYESELTRAHDRWQESPNLSKCAEILLEKADLELCQTASGALTAVERLAPTATPEVAVPVLSDAALALVRLVERTRYLSLEELGRMHVEGDAGAPNHAASARPPPPPAPSASGALPPLSRGIQKLLRERPRLKVGETPLSLFVQDTARLERDVLRHLGAYLEYAPLPARQSTCEAVRRLQAQHSSWPALNHLLREASVLETEPALKHNESELASLGFPRGKRPDQPTGSK